MSQMRPKRINSNVNPQMYLPRLEWLLTGFDSKDCSGTFTGFTPGPASISFIFIPHNRCHSHLLMLLLKKASIERHYLLQLFPDLLKRDRFLHLTAYSMLFRCCV